MCGDRVVGEALLQQAGQRRPHEGAVEPEFVHQGQTRLGREERLGRTDRIPHQLAACLPFGIAVLEELLGRTGSADHVERRVGDVLGDDVANRNFGAPVDLDVLDQSRVLGRQELREGVRRLVHVIVGVEDGEIDNGFRHDYLRRTDRNSPVRLHEASGYFQLRRQYYRKGGRPAQIGALSGTRPHRDAWHGLARPAKLCIDAPSGPPAPRRPRSSSDRTLPLRKHVGAPHCEPPRPLRPGGPGRRHGVREPGKRARDQGPLSPPHALQPGRSARSARGAATRRRARSSRTSGRFGVNSPRTTRSSSARPRNSGSITPCKRSSA